MTEWPEWLSPLPDSGQQRAIDAWAIDELGIPGVTLMERAGIALADLVDATVPRGPVVVVAGGGNNGGDGLVTARHLRLRGREVAVLLLAAPEDLRGDARVNLERLAAEADLRSRPFDAGGLDRGAVIVDAILGTGFTGEPRDAARAAIAAINAAGAPVIACDVPSGVDASTGEVSGAAVRAVATATFHAAKPGLWIAPGKAHAGTVEVIDIGIPAGAPVAPEIGLITAGVLGHVPSRGRDATKFAAGAVLVCGGSAGLTGAPCLAAEAAMRAGAGYVTALVPASLSLVFEQRLLEVMSVALPDGEGALTLDAADAVLERTARADALVLGPGLGRAHGSVELARTVARHAEIPLVLDADGLNAHAGRLGALAQRPAPTVLTPHAGELARLLECDAGEIAARRLACALRASATSGAVVVLKGDDTIVAAPDGRAAISPGDAPALATAGSGDVLSGVIGAFLSKRMDAFEAACAGVLVHLHAGRLAAQEIGAEGVIAGDVLALLPRARAGES